LHGQISDLNSQIKELRTKIIVESGTRTEHSPNRGYSQKLQEEYLKAAEENFKRKLAREIERYKEGFKTEDNHMVNLAIAALKALPEGDPKKKKMVKLAKKKAEGELFPPKPVDSGKEASRGQVFSKFSSKKNG
jgi:hypothetical protein